MGTMWFEKGVGDRALLEKQDPDADPNGPCAILIADARNVPDWVRLPPQLGGSQARVTGGFMANCPCGREHETWHLRTNAMNNGKALHVAECPFGGFMWHTRG